MRFKLKCWTVSSHTVLAVSEYFPPIYIYIYIYIYIRRSVRAATHTNVGQATHTNVGPPKILLMWLNRDPSIRIHVRVATSSSASYVMWCRPLMSCVVGHSYYVVSATHIMWCRPLIYDTYIYTLYISIHIYIYIYIYIQT